MFDQSKHTSQPEASRLEGLYRPHLGHRPHLRRGLLNEQALGSAGAASKNAGVVTIASSRISAPAARPDTVYDMLRN